MLHGSDDIESIVTGWSNATTLVISNVSMEKQLQSESCNHNGDNTTSNNSKNSADADGDVEAVALHRAFQKEILAHPQILAMLQELPPETFTTAQLRAMLQGLINRSAPQLTVPVDVEDNSNDNSDLSDPSLSNHSAGQSTGAPNTALGGASVPSNSPPAATSPTETVGFMSESRGGPSTRSASVAATIDSGSVGSSIATTTAPLTASSMESAGLLSESHGSIKDEEHPAIGILCNDDENHNNHNGNNNNNNDTHADTIDHNDPVHQGENIVAPARNRS